MLWSVQWCMGGEGDRVGVFELAEGELGLGLGAVSGHYLGGGPGLPVGDQDAFAEDFGFQVGAGVGVGGEGESVCGWGVTGQFPADDASGPGVVVRHSASPRRRARRSHSGSTPSCELLDVASWSAQTRVPMRPASFGGLTKPYLT
jgi:hypothetical protein